MTLARHNWTPLPWQHLVTVGHRYHDTRSSHLDTVAMATTIIPTVTTQNRPLIYQNPRKSTTLSPKTTASPFQPNHHNSLNLHSCLLAHIKYHVSLNLPTPKNMKIKKNIKMDLPAPILIPYLFLLRLFNAFTIKTFFQPDEYWQALEPAMLQHYGYGYKTWEWNRTLRSYLHPLIYQFGYIVADFLDLPPEYMPLVINAVIATLGDFYLYKWVSKVTRNDRIAKISLALSVTSAFNWFFLTRSFSNSFEMVLTTIALYYWPRSRGMLLACLCCVIRPTNGLIWLVLGAYTWFKSGFKLKLVFRAISCGAIGIGISLAVDYYYYGKLVFPIVNFVKFNLESSQFYGVAPWHFHFSQSLAVVFTTMLPVLAIGMVTTSYKLYRVVFLVSMVFFSCVAHKEFRFIYPLQPFCMLIMSEWLYKHSALFKKLFPLVIIANGLISYYFTTIHESGVVDVIDYLRHEPYVDSIGLLTPCHSTPWQSHLQRPDIETWFLTCEPPEKYYPGYMDESDYFYEDPVSFLYQHFPPPYKAPRAPGKSYTHEWPTHLVFFEALEDTMKEYLNESPYEECARFFNSRFHWDSRRNGDVIVYCRDPFSL